ncbi:hypothetical protein [Polyangium sp. y55x31]|uniref:hypothetical protein n=1 Tax=Polyangium sp. y55x31 TaxID=3042688 RepID=UPI002482C477|nr:hypothetical protein [Polyangium sp. y55x31]MDI1475518.1 hypothetical protein [Polyangium sp. y55x31]
MSLRKQWSFLGTSAACALGLCVVLSAACRAEENNNPSGGDGGSGATGASGPGSGGTGGTGGAGGAGGSGGAGGATCDGKEVTIEQITNSKASGAVGKGTPVKVKGAVAMSHKFLVSQSNAGNCLWGVFVSAPGLAETKEYSGVIALSYGVPAAIPPGGNKAYCPKLSNYYEGDPLPGDAIPDDVKPGDVLDITGVADSFLLAACANEMNGSKVPQTQIAFTCAVERTGTAPLPAPHAFTDAAEVAKLGSATDADFHNKWGGVKVRVSNAKPVPQPNPAPMGMGEVVVGDFGVIKLQDSNVEVGDKIYYRGYEQNDCYAAPVFSDVNMTFNSIDGFSYLSYCTWGLQPDGKCTDFDPKSEDCGSLTCQ